ncbi:MAG: glycosyl transferase family 41 [Selenomonas sp.]|uniref:O-linked N-acetylglucosamine transferase, SPINDLY family protein n=1 Tax=Selenomonas sp. TaxID=2053611 RepID=UPI0025E80BDB|nr:glycosyl transferase family 41 [Selenomonas sp.]MCI6231187.1 glycosyl transferase family 41 [Selenomonas sp.]
MGNKKEEPWRTFEQRGAACRRKGDAVGCARAYFEAAQCDRFLRSQREHYSSYLFTLHYLSGISAEELARQHFVYGQLYREELAETTRSVAGDDSVSASASEKIASEAVPIVTSGERRLRIGFLSLDFLESSAARFYEALLGLPKDAFEVFAYSLSDEADDFTSRVQSMAEHYRVLSSYDIESSEQAIVADNLDILVDLGGHTAGGATLMLLAHHPARIIIEAVGWFDTTGMPTVDYLLTDDVMDPPGREALLSEQPLRLPHAWCFMPSRAMRAARERIGRRRRKQAPGSVPVRLASFQNFLKISDDTLDAWRAILDRAPQAHLLLQDTMRVPARVTELERRLRAAGLPMERVTARMGSDDYLDGLAAQDLVLDTFPYPGGAMTATALYLGVPVLTLSGDSHSRSVGASILTAAERTELIAESVGEYVEKAARLIAQPGEVAALRMRLLEEIPFSPLCNAAAYRKNFFDFFSKIT